MRANDSSAESFLFLVKGKAITPRTVEHLAGYLYFRELPRSYQTLMGVSAHTAFQNFLSILVQESCN